jgi:hypothetical protein
MDRLNGEGIPRRLLSTALKDRKQVLGARKINSCLLCRRIGVNEAGLCEVCYAMLEGEELNLAVRWLQGVGP